MILELQNKFKNNLKDIFIWEKHAVSNITAKNGGMAKGWEYVFMLGQDNLSTFKYNDAKTLVIFHKYPPDEDIFDPSTNGTELRCTKESKRSIYTDESSGGQLQGILERLVEQDHTVTNKLSSSSIKPSENMVPKLSIQEEKVKSKGNRTVIDNTRFDQSDTANTSFDDLEDTNPSKARFEMFDPNEQSKIYLNQRQKQGKKSKRNYPTRIEKMRSKSILKNCGLIPELALSPGSTISMSSCSLDSVLDDPERLEKYRLLNQPPPSPPPRRSMNKSDSLGNHWSEQFLKLMLETYGKVSRLFGCASS
jgi:hypothetical protein